MDSLIHLIQALAGSDEINKQDILGKLFPAESKAHEAPQTQMLTQAKSQMLVSAHVWTGFIL
jgi:hypothetical protein